VKALKGAAKRALTLWWRRPVPPALAMTEQMGL